MMTPSINTPPTMRSSPLPADPRYTVSISSERRSRKTRRRTVIRLVAPCLALVVIASSAPSYCSAFQNAGMRSLLSTSQATSTAHSALFSTTEDRRIRTRVQERDPSFDPIKHQGSSAKQFTPRYVAYEGDKLMGKTMQAAPEIRKANPDTLPTVSEQLQLTEKISRLLSSDNCGAFGVHDEDAIADKQTVFAKLSDEDLREASDAVSKANNIKVSPTNAAAKKIKLTANVMETGQDTIKQYVKSLANHQVLSAEDEAVLGRQIQILSKWEEKRQELEDVLLRAPTFAEWAAFVDTTVPELKTQIRRSQKAKAALVEANLRLVVTVARQMVKKNRSEISFTDACQEGILGLSRASEKFDPEKGFRFSSYAVWWIRKMIHKNVSEQSRPVRLPASAMRKINDIRIHEKVLQDELGRRPRDDEVAAKVGMTVAKLDFYRRSLQEVQSLDKKVKFNKASDNSGNDPELHQIVKDPSQSPDQLANAQMLKDDVRRLIKTLSPREQAVIRLRFGLDNGTPATLDDIATKFKVDKEQIRKLEARALRKLQQPYRNQSLKSYMNDL